MDVICTSVPFCFNLLTDYFAMTGLLGTCCAWTEHTQSINASYGHLQVMAHPKMDEQDRMMDDRHMFVNGVCACCGLKGVHTSYALCMCV